MAAANGSAGREPTGFVGRALADVGVPYADAAGAAVTFVVVLVGVYALGRLLVRPVFDRVLDSRNLDQHAKSPLRRLFTVVLLFAATGVAFAFAGFGNILTGLATVAAAATLAIGLAMQNTIQNFVSGVFIYADRPFRIGDWIQWDTHEGVVEDISLRVTRVRTFDNELLTVPNSQLTDGVIKNPVAKNQLRMKFLFGIAYDDDVERASEVIVEAADAHPDILADPEPSVRLTELGDSAVGLQSRFWIADPSRADFVQTRSEYVANVKERFEEEGVTIPFPNRTLSGEVTVEGREVVVGDPGSVD